MVIVNTGDGKGKSTAAMGMVMRAVARHWKVAVVQFIKSGDWKVGEEKIGRRLGVDWDAVGDGFSWDSEDLDRSAALAGEAWRLAKAGSRTVTTGWWSSTRSPTRSTGVDRRRRGGLDHRPPARKRQRGGHRPGRSRPPYRGSRHGDRDDPRQARLRPGHRRHPRHRLLKPHELVIPDTVSRELRSSLRHTSREAVPVRAPLFGPIALPIPGVVPTH